MAQLTLPTRKIKYLSRRGSITSRTEFLLMRESKKTKYGRLAQLVAYHIDIVVVTYRPNREGETLLFLRDENTQGEALSGFERERAKCGALSLLSSCLQD